LNAVQYIICSRPSIGVHREQLIQEGVELGGKIRSYSPGVVKPSPMCDLVAKLIQVFIIFVDNIGTAIREFCETQKIQDLSQ